MAGVDFRPFVPTWPSKWPDLGLQGGKSADGSERTGSGDCFNTLLGRRAGPASYVKAMSKRQEPIQFLTGSQRSLKVYQSLLDLVVGRLAQIKRGDEHYGGRDVSNIP